MKVNVIETSKTSRTLEIEVPDEQVLAEIEQAFKRVAKQAEVPGFRKGKIPRSILEKKFRASVEQDVLDRILPDALYKAVDEHKLKIVGQPRIEDLKPGLPPLSFKAIVDIKPEFKLKDVSGLKLEAPSEKVEDKDIEDQLDQLRQRSAVAGAAVDRAAKKGDHVRIDFKGFKDEVAFPGGEAKDYSLTLGSNSFIPGFEEGIEGMKAGQEKSLKLTFPKDYQNADLKGAKVVFEVKLNEVKELDVPAADDAFAATLGDFKTIQEIRDKIRESLQKQKSDNRRNALAAQAEEQLAKNHQFDLPESLVGYETRLILDRQEMNLKRQGMEFKADDAIRVELASKARPAAEMRTRVRLVLEKIVEEQKMEATHEELHKEIHKLAPGMGLMPEQAVQWFHEGGREDGLRQQMLEQKALEWVISEAKIKEGK